MRKLALLLLLGACARPPLLNGRGYAAETPRLDGPPTAAATGATGAPLDDSAFPALARRPHERVPTVDRRLPSGVRMVVMQDRSFPYVQMTMLVGRRREVPAPASEVLATALQSWVSHWNGGRDIFDSAIISARIHPDALVFSMDALSGTFAEVGPRFLQRLTRTEFDRRELSRFTSYFEAIDRERSPTELGAAMLAKSMYPASNGYGQTHSVAATLEDVSASEVETVRRTMMVRDNITVAAVGDVAPDALERMIEEQLKALAPTASPRPSTFPLSACNGEGTFIERSGSSQSWVRMAWPAVPASHADGPALRYLAAASGSSLSARLNRSVRGALGASYGVRAHAALLHDDGTFEIEMGLDPSKAAVSLAQIDADIEVLRTSTLERAEIDAATRRMRIVDGSPSLALERYRDESRRIPTAEEIRVAAEKYLVRAKRCLVIVGDPKSPH